MISRKIEIDDLEKISKLHKKIFDSSHFSVHYPIDLLKKFFKMLMERNEYFFLVEDKARNILGFVIGGSFTQVSVDEFIKENKFAVILVTLNNPLLWLQSFKKLYKRLFFKKKKSRANVRLYLIGTDPNAHSRGVGSLLINRFEEALRLDEIYLYGLYVKSDNNKAIKFYEKCGFKFEFKRYDLISYVKEI